MNRSTFHRWSMPVLATLLFATLLPGCGRKKTAAPQTSVIRVSGAWALYPLMQRWSEIYMKQHPELRIEISAGGAGKGMTDCLSGLVDLAMLSREVRPEERAKGAVSLPVARDAVFAVVNASHPKIQDLRKNGLRRSHLLDLFRKEKPAGFQVYTRSDACGAAEVWAQYLGGRQEDLKGIAVFGDPGIAEAVRKDAQSIGYNNLAFAFDPRTGLPYPGLAIVSLDLNENGTIDPDEDVSTRDKALAAIISGHYPAPPSRDLFLVLKGNPNGAVKTFLHWILNEGQPIASECGFVPIGVRGREALAAMPQ